MIDSGQIEISAFIKYRQPQNLMLDSWDITNNVSSSVTFQDVHYNYSATSPYIYDSIAATNVSGNYALPETTTNNALATTAGGPQETQVFLLITYGIFLTSIGVLGIAGNALSIIVLSSPKMKSSINCCLIGLASFDIIVLISSILMFGIKHLFEFTYTCLVYNRLILPYSIPYLYQVGMSAQTGSVWVTVTVTVERYVAVCLPLRARSLCTYGRARIYIIAITIFSVMYNISRFWEVEVYSEVNLSSGELEAWVGPSPLRENQRYVNIYITWMYLFVLYFIPFLILAVLNGIIWLKVRKANRERQRLSRLQQKEMGLAIMLFCVVVVFFICNLLALMVNILEISGIIIDELTACSNLLVTMNSSVNFVIYCIFGQKFRRILLRNICSCCPASFAGRRLVERGGELEESTYPVSSVNTNETKLLMHYNGTGNSGHCSSGGYRGSVHRASLSAAATTTTLFDNVTTMENKSGSTTCGSILTRSTSELGNANFKVALSVSASPCTGSLRIHQPHSHAFKCAAYNKLNFRSSSKLEMQF